MKTQPVTIGRNTTAAEERTDPRGRAAIAVLAALAVSCVGLIAFVIGVGDGSDTETPRPDAPPSVEVEVPPRGIDQRLYELAERHAARMERESVPGPDQRLYELAGR